MLEYSADWSQWLYVAAPFAVYFAVVGVLVAFGDDDGETDLVRRFFRRISTGLTRATGYPGWAVAGGLTGLAMLGAAAIGLYWDVAFHVDFGRDRQLFTPSHTMIVLALGGLFLASVVSVIFATLDRVPVGFRLGPLTVPWTALGMAAMGAGGVAAFPLDALWHEAYGIDVTLWSPTHLQLVAGGSWSTIVIWLMLREAGPVRPTRLGRVVEATVLGAVLTGMSTFQGEFDFGVPQFQVLYLPLLIAVAGAFSLVLARLGLGRWGATRAVVAYLAIRGVIALLLGGPFNETVPHFPLYLVAGLTVDLAGQWLGTRRRVRFVLVASLLAGTVGVAADLAWLALLRDIDPTLALLPEAALLTPLAAVGGGLLAGALARPVGGGRIPAFVAPLALAGLVVILAYPLPRKVGDVQAAVRLVPAGDGATVEVELRPADAAEEATAFGVVAWQGGGTVVAGLEQTGPGRYVSTRPLPVDGRWKTLVGLQRGDQVMAAAVYMPADPEIGAPEVRAEAGRFEPMVRNTKLLLREQHDGADWVANASYAGVAAIGLMWFGLFALAAAKAPVVYDLEEEEERASRPGRRSASSARHRPPSGPGPASGGPIPAGSGSAR